MKSLCDLIITDTHDDENYPNKTQNIMFYIHCWFEWESHLQLVNKNWNNDRH